MNIALSAAAPAVTALPTGAPSPAPARPSFGVALRRHGAALPSAAPPPTHPARAVLEHLERTRERLDGVLAAARRGQTFTPQELLALQSEAYRYSQALDVASKVVEHGAQSVKQAVNTQV